MRTEAGTRIILLERQAVASQMRVRNEQESAR
jgi:hypothetical protein